MTISNYSFTADAQNSSSLKPVDNTNIALSLDFATGSGIMTIDLERKIGSGAWKVVESYTADTEKNIQAVSNDCVYRCTTSAFTSGAVTMNMAAPT